MSLEQKVQTGERSLLKRFLNSAKSKLFNCALGLAMLAPLACDGRHKTPAPEPVNNAPVITTTAPASSLEGSLYNYDVDASDAEGDAISYSLDVAPLWASINATSGLITGTPSDSGANRTDNFSVRATDAKGAYSVQNFGVNVTNLGTVSGVISDVYTSNGLLNIVVDLYNSTYSQGTFTSTTSSTGNFSISGVPDGTYTFKAWSSSNPIYPNQILGLVTSGNSTIKNSIVIPKPSSPQIASTNSAYLDPTSTYYSFLAFFKTETGTTLSSLPTGGPHRTTNWPSFPVSVFLDIANAPSGDSDLNGTKDYIDQARTAMSTWNTKANMTLFTEVSSNPSTGIKFLYPAIPTGGGNGWTNHVSYNLTDGSNQYKTVEIATGLPLTTVLKVMKHELGHTIYNINHSADTLYILHSSVSASDVHNDEGKAAELNAKLPHRTDMDEHLDQ